MNSIDYNEKSLSDELLVNKVVKLILQIWFCLFSDRLRVYKHSSCKFPYSHSLIFKTRGWYIFEPLNAVQYTLLFSRIGILLGIWNLIFKELWFSRNEILKQKSNELIFEGKHYFQRKFANLSWNIAMLLCSQKLSSLLPLKCTFIWTSCRSVSLRS